MVEYLLEECASPQQLVQSYRPKMPPQSVGHRHSGIFFSLLLWFKFEPGHLHTTASVGSAQNVGCLCVAGCLVVVLVLVDVLIEVLVPGYKSPAIYTPVQSAAHVPAADGDSARGAAGSGSET